ncbi:ubiquitin thioesterase Otu1 [Atheta coriaria]|uniref:ubiquitin thioesterase Otu1 n=1 Tax=Dalotia coriaria TaxID=877792 RepID=UPI0031F3BC7B
MTRYALRVKTKEGQQVVNTLTAESTAKELRVLLANISNIPENKLHILSGFPPKPLILNDSETLNVNGITSGDTLILQELNDASTASSNVPAVKPSVTSTAPSKTDDHYQEQESASVSGILMKHVVPADNSCLFTSIHFVLNGKVDETGSVAPWMRNIIAETVSRDPETYSDAILGKANSEYCKWIKDDKSWGGGIEISILSSYYGIEIAVVDIVNAIINRFGEDQNYGQRVFLLFDGIHYDPLYLESTSGEHLRTIFPTEDEKVYRDAEQLAIEAKSSRQYTDVNKFTLRCVICDIRLKGQTEAQQHAQETGHANFGEI